MVNDLSSGGLGVSGIVTIVDDLVYRHSPSALSFEWFVVVVGVVLIVFVVQAPFH